MFQEMQERRVQMIKRLHNFAFLKGQLDAEEKEFERIEQLADEYYAPDDPMSSDEESATEEKAKTKGKGKGKGKGKAKGKGKGKKVVQVNEASDFNDNMDVDDESESEKPEPDKSKVST